MSEMSLPERDRRCLWHPYTQMKDYARRELPVIERAEGLFLYDLQGRRYYDTISSWWCILHGHRHPTIARAVHEQLDRLEQVLLAGFSHPPAIELAERLVAITPPGLAKVFYSDNGSTACEIAIKMSLQYWRQTGHPERNRFVALERGYHGDTIGTMSLGGVPEFHQAFAGLLFDSYRLPAPECYRCPMGKERGECGLECLTPFAELLEREGKHIAGFILEPLLQAAGGMNIYPPAYLQKAADLARAHGVHLILDEVATGFGRTGRMFALEYADLAPDFLCLSKGLTGGFLPLAATLTTDEVYEAFYGDYAEGRTFFHGHTFTGNPLGVAAALGSLRVFAEEDVFGRLGRTIPYLHRKMARLRELPWVGDLRLLGTVAAIELVKDRKTKEGFPPADRVAWPLHLQGLEEGILLRPLGNVVYLWLPLSVTEADIDEITDRLWRVLADPGRFGGWPRT
ncbi:MAG: adenosylmethionine--8-amino-7-oxononanoate transaminase [Desulfobacteraceae bacterium]|nr:adenosylmethionine--8-amino-7-oxononanoate transaminase [Desulfobacteraceae bacterium]